MPLLGQLKVLSQTIAHLANIAKAKANPGSPALSHNPKEVCGWFITSLQRAKSGRHGDASLPAPGLPWGDIEWSPLPAQTLLPTRASDHLAKGCPKPCAGEERWCCPGVISLALNCGVSASLSADMAQLMASVLSSTEPSLSCGRAKSCGKACRGEQRCYQAE